MITDFRLFHHTCDFGILAIFDTVLRLLSILFCGIVVSGTPQCPPLSVVSLADTSWARLDLFVACADDCCSVFERICMDGENASKKTMVWMRSFWCVFDENGAFRKLSVMKTGTCGRGQSQPRPQSPRFFWMLLKDRGLAGRDWA